MQSLQVPGDVEVLSSDAHYAGRVFLGRLLEVRHGYGLVEYPSDTDPVPEQEWVPVPRKQQKREALLRSGVAPALVKDYLEQDDLLLPAWGRSIVLRPHSTQRLKAHERDWPLLPVDTTVEVQLRSAPQELVMGYVNLVNGRLAVRRLHEVEGLGVITFSSIAALYAGHSRWDPHAREWTVDWALPAKVQPGEQVLRKTHLPASVKTDKLVFAQLRVGEEVYHRCLVRHAAPDGSVLDIKVFKGAADGVHDRVEVIRAGSTRIWTGTPSELVEVPFGSGRWRVRSAGDAEIDNSDLHQLVQQQMMIQWQLLIKQHQQQQQRLMQQPQQQQQQHHQTAQQQQEAAEDVQDDVSQGFEEEEQQEGASHPQRAPASPEQQQQQQQQEEEDEAVQPAKEQSMELEEQAKGMEAAPGTPPSIQHDPVPHPEDADAMAITRGVLELPGAAGKAASRKRRKGSAATGSGRPRPRAEQQQQQQQQVEEEKEQVLSQQQQGPQKKKRRTSNSSSGDDTKPVNDAPSKRQRPPAGRRELRALGLLPPGSKRTKAAAPEPAVAAAAAAVPGSSTSSGTRARLGKVAGSSGAPERRQQQQQQQQQEEEEEQQQEHSEQEEHDEEQQQEQSEQEEEQLQQEQYEQEQEEQSGEDEEAVGEGGEAAGDPAAAAAADGPALLFAKECAKADIMRKSLKLSGRQVEPYFPEAAIHGSSLLLDITVKDSMGVDTAMWIRGGSNGNYRRPCYYFGPIDELCRRHSVQCNCPMVLLRMPDGSYKIEFDTPRARKAADDSKKAGWLASSLAHKTFAVHKAKLAAEAAAARAAARAAGLLEPGAPFTAAGSSAGAAGGGCGVGGSSAWGVLAAAAGGATRNQLREITSLIGTMGGAAQAHFVGVECMANVAAAANPPADMPQLAAADTFPEQRAALLQYLEEAKNWLTLGQTQAVRMLLMELEDDESAMEKFQTLQYSMLCHAANTGGAAGPGAAADLARLRLLKLNPAAGALLAQYGER